MSHLFHPPQANGRSSLRAQISEYSKRREGSWKNEALLAFRLFHADAAGLKRSSSPESIDYSQRLLAKLGGAAAHVECELCGLWLAGVRFVPGQELVHCVSPEGFLLLDANGGISPVVVGHSEILLQCGESPFVFTYTIDTDLNPLFRNAIIPESFF